MPKKTLARLTGAHNTWSKQDFDGYRAAHAMAEVLNAAGVKHIYTQSCPTALIIAAQQVGIQLYGFRTENAGAAMADGTARASNRISVITAQNGPAACLLVPGLAEALKASVPILAIVQEVPHSSQDKNAFQELEHEKIFSGCTKWVRRINDPQRAAEYVTKAITVATSGKPGPVVLLISPDTISKPVGQRADVNDLPRNFGKFPLDRPVPTADLTELLAKRLMAAKNPLIVAGGGVHLSGAALALERLQEKSWVPVATTNMGKGAVDETLALSIGVIGNAMGERSQGKHFKSYIDQADFILFVGARTNENGTSGWSLFPSDAQYAHIDMDPEEIGRNYPGMRLVGDARETLMAVANHITQKDQKDVSTRTQRIKNAFHRARQARDAEALEFMQTPSDGALHPEALMRTLDQHAVGDELWVADASYSSIWLAQFVRSQRAGTRFITPRGLAGLGWGFPMAIGAKLACPSQHVICVTGDGGFSHCWSELESAKRHGIALTLIVLKNNVLGFQKEAEKSRFDSYSSICNLFPVDHLMIARACGCDGMRVSNLEELHTALDVAKTIKLPYIIEANVDPEAFPPITAFESMRHRDHHNDVQLET